MSLQSTEPVDLGELKVTNQKFTIYTVDNIGTSVALLIYDPLNNVGGVAHIVLPESSLAPVQTPEQAPAKFADLAVPALFTEFEAQGGSKRAAMVKIVGGAQLFNFGGGAGNFLNIGARNAMAVRAAVSKLGCSIGKADTGGNKGKNIRFEVSDGQITVEQIGGKEYVI